MDDDLVKDWGKLKLTEDENRVYGSNYDEDDDGASKTRIALSLVGKLLTKKPFDVEAIKRVLKNIWRLLDNVAIRMIEMNLFVFQFFDESNKERVMEGRPWAFDNQILFLQELKGDE